MDETKQRGGDEATNSVAATEQLLQPASTGDYDTDARLDLMIATFASDSSARKAFNTVKQAERDEQILLVDVALVSRDDGNRLHVHDELDWPGRVGAALGIGIGAILGTFAGPLGLVVGGAAGGALGGAAAAASDAGMSDAELKELASGMQPGASMLVVVVAEMWSIPTQAILSRAGGEVKTITLTDEMAGKLHLAFKLHAGQAGV